MLRSLILVLALSVTASAQLAGTYTLHPFLPAGGTNFVSFQDAVTALSTQGVIGPVVIEVFDDAGPFQESVPFTGLALGNSMACVALTSWPGASATNTVTFQPAAGEQPVLDANGNGVVVWWGGADYTTLRGFELIGATEDAVCMYTESTLDAQFNTLDALHIHDCGGVGVLTYGNSGLVTDTLIQNCVFHDLLTNSSRGSFANFIRDGYIAGRRDQNTRILHNTIIMNTAAGTARMFAIGNYPSGTSRNGFTEIQGNVVVKTATSGTVYFWNSAPPFPAIFDRNILWDQSGSPFALYAGANLMDLLAWQQTTAADLNSIAIDPLLGGTAAFPYLPQVGSPCVNFVPNPNGVATDYFRNARDAMPDCGAIEQTCPIPEYQLNSAEASLDLNGVTGGQCMPAVTTSPAGMTLIATFESNLSGMGFEAMIGPGGLVPRSAGALTSSQGQVINVDVLARPLVFVHGGLMPSFSVPFFNRFSVPWIPPVANFTASIQSAHLDPTRLDGLVLSQGCELVVP